jgi:hypothetical protein
MAVSFVSLRRHSPRFLIAGGGKWQLVIGNPQRIFSVNVCHHGVEQAFMPAVILPYVGGL